MKLKRPTRALRSVIFRLYRWIVSAVPGGRIDAFGPDVDRIAEILVINLDRQPHRLKRTMRELTRFRDQTGQQLTDLVKRLPAVDARDGRAVAATADVDPQYLLGNHLYVQPDDRLEACFDQNEAVKMTRQEIAVARSHIEAWKAIAAGSKEHVLVLEDDVWFCGGAAAKIDRAWCEVSTREADERLTLLYLSYEDAGGLCERVDEHGTLFRPLRGLWFLSGYVLSRRGAQLLLQALPVVGPVDMWINRKFDLLRPLAIDKPVILQRLDAGSDNSYSVMPFLARAGIVDAGDFSSPARSVGIRILAWTDRGAHEPLAMALSMLGLRVLTFDDIEGNVVVDDVTTYFDNFDVLVDPPFAPNAIPEGIASTLTGLVLEPKQARRIDTFSRRKYSWTILPGEKPGEDWWSPLCSLAGLNTPTQEFPIGTPSQWRLFRDDRQCLNSKPELIPLAKDETPWALGKVDEHVPPICDAIPIKEDRTVKMWCTLTEPSTDMPAIRGTFPGNLANFELEAIDYSPKGTTIMLSPLKLGDRPFRSGALSSVRHFLHGRFEIEMKAAKGEGIVTGFFLHRHAPRQEIDIEIIGKEPGKMLVNVYFNPGNEGTQLDYGYRGSPSVIDLGFDASANFHLYAIEWLPDRIRWFVDDVLVHERGSWNPTPIPHLAMTLHANLWSPRSFELAGEVDSQSIMTAAAFRSVKVTS